MPESPHDHVEVLAGAHGELRWQVWTGGTHADLVTTLRVFDGERCVASSGFAGPALYPGTRVHEWRGRTDDLPFFVMARTAAEVSRLIAVTDRGTRVALLMGDVDPRFGLRFAVAGLPEGEGPAVLLVEVDGQPDSSLAIAAW